jgi:hypothetical protein
MSWFVRRASGESPDPALALSFAEDFAGVVERSFPIEEAALASVRGRVLAAFIEAVPARSSSVHRRPARRGLSIALAASAGLLVVGAAAVQAQPGSPFYPVKLSLETATLPSADSASGWQARLDRLEHRIDEGLAAEADRNPGALEAALVEYRSELAGLVAATADPARRSELVSRASQDLGIVVNLDQAFPSEAATLLINDIRALIQPPASENGVGMPDRGAPISGNPHADGTTGDPHDGPARGNPHSDEAAGNPHAGDAPGKPPTSGGGTGNPHVEGNGTGNPPATGTTGNPHQSGDSTGKPDPDGTTGNPHPSGGKGNPHGGTTGNPHGDGT